MRIKKRLRHKAHDPLYSECSHCGEFREIFFSLDDAAEEEIKFLCHECAEEDWWPTWGARIARSRRIQARRLMDRLRSKRATQREIFLALWRLYSGWGETDKSKIRKRIRKLQRGKL